MVVWDFSHQQYFNGFRIRLFFVFSSNSFSHFVIWCQGWNVLPTMSMRRPHPFSRLAGFGGCLGVEGSLLGNDHISHPNGKAGTSSSSKKCHFWEWIYVIVTREGSLMSAFSIDFLEYVFCLDLWTMFVVP